MARQVKGRYGSRAHARVRENRLLVVFLIPRSPFFFRYGVSIYRAGSLCFLGVREASAPRNGDEILIKFFSRFFREFQLGIFRNFIRRPRDLNFQTLQHKFSLYTLRKKFN